MRLNYIIRNFLFVLFGLYFAQGWLYESGSFLSQICIVIIILISGIYLVKSLLIQDRINILFIAWTFFICINLICFIVSPDFADGRPRDAIKNTMGCMLPFYAFYYFARTGSLKARYLILFSLLILPIIIVQYYINLDHFMVEYDLEADEVVNNTAYSFVALIPYVFLLKRQKLLSWGLMLVIIVFVLQGSKRGAIIAAFIGLFMFIYYQLKVTPKNHRVFDYLSIAVLIVILGFFIYRMSSSNEFMLKRLTLMLEGDTSGREYLYSSIWNNWLNSNNFINLLFGYGLAGSVKLAGGLAHNDWLEVLSNFGVVGFFAYGFLFYAALKTILQSGWMPEKKLLMATMVAIWFFITLVSMWYTNMIYFTNAILFGYLIGNQEKEWI